MGNLGQALSWAWPILGHAKGHKVGVARREPLPSFGHKLGCALIAGFLVLLVIEESECESKKRQEKTRKRKENKELSRFQLLLFFYFLFSIEPTNRTVPQRTVVLSGSSMSEEVMRCATPKRGNSRSCSAMT